MSAERETINGTGAAASPQPLQHEAGPSLPSVPRSPTARARRRSWGEMSVRIWLILTVAIAIVTGYFTATRYLEAKKDRWLIENGVEVDAIFTSVSGDPVPKRRPRNETLIAAITFEHEGKRYDLEVPRLEAKPGAFAVVGEALPIKIDPNDPARWTEETLAKPWVQELTAVGLLAPVLLVLAIITLWKRRGVLSTWQNDPLVSAIVVETRQTAVAPLSRIVRFTLPESGDARRVWSTLMPTSAGIPAKGDTLWLICPPNNPGRAIVARLYA